MTAEIATADDAVVASPARDVHVPAWPNLRSRLTTELGVLAVGQGLAAIGMLVGVRLLTGFLSPGVYGAVSLELGILMFAANLFCNPLMQSTLRLYSEAKAHASVRELRLDLRSLLTKGVAICAAIALVATVIEYAVAGRKSWIALPMIALLSVDIARNVELVVLNASRSQRSYSIWSAADQWVRPLAAVALIYLVGAQSGVVLLGFAIGTGGLYLLLHRALVVVPPISRPPSTEEMAKLRHDLISCAVPLIPLAAVSWFSSVSDRYIVAALAGVSRVGVYVAAYGLASRGFQILGTVLTLGIRPVYFAALTAKDTDAERRILLRWVLATASLGAGGVIVVALLKRPLAFLLLSAPFRESAPLMPWIALGYAMVATSDIFDTINIGHKRPGFVVASQLVGAIGSVGFGIPFIWRFGVRGAAWAVPLYFAGQLICSAWLAQRSRRRWHAAVDGECSDQPVRRDISSEHEQRPRT